jgi:hypothetical protein
MKMTVTEAPVLTVDLTKRARQYRELREKITEIKDRHKEELAPYQSAYNDLKAWLLHALNDLGVENVQTAEGTVHKKSLKTFPLEDASAFLGFIIENRAWEMLDLKCNSTAAQEFLEEYGELPPGVKMSVHVDSSVLAPRKKG